MLHNYEVLQQKKRDFDMPIAQTPGSVRQAWEKPKMSVEEEAQMYLKNLRENPSVRGSEGDFGGIRVQSQQLPAGTKLMEDRNANDWLYF